MRVGYPEGPDEGSAEEVGGVVRGGGGRVVEAVGECAEEMLDPRVGAEGAEDTRKCSLGDEDVTGPGDGD